MVIIDDYRAGNIPANGIFTFLSKKDILQSVRIQGGVPTNKKEKISSRTESLTEIIDEDQIALSISLSISPSNRFVIRAIVPDQLLVQVTSKEYILYDITEYSAPSERFNVRNGSNIVLNYTEKKYNKEETVTSLPSTETVSVKGSWECYLTSTNMNYKPIPESYYSDSFRVVFGPYFTRPNMGTNNATYIAYINLNLTGSNGELISSERIVREKTITF